MEHIELRGILETISNRFYSGGWGFGTLRADSGKTTKITGTLEGHVVGTSLIVRGVYKDGKYGLQLDCASIVVDSVSGSMTVIRAWAKKYMDELQDEIAEAMLTVEPEERWDVLCDAVQLLGTGMDPDIVEVVAKEASSYLRLIANKRALMEKGFTDAEAGKMCDEFPDTVFELLEADPYVFTIERIVVFNRIDAVVGDSVRRNDKRRLQAACTQALVAAERNGHTALCRQAVVEEAAEMAGIYPDSFAQLQMPESIRLYNNHLQLVTCAIAEQNIATWIHQALGQEE